VSLLEHQIVLGRCLQATGVDPLAADMLQGLTIDREELARLRDLVHCPGFRFTRHVQRSWCIGRTAGAAQLTLSLLPVELRRELVGDWVEAGGGRALDVAVEAAAFLEFVAQRLPYPSHALAVCRMEQAAYRASDAAVRFKPPDPSLLDDPEIILGTGKNASVVRFFAEPERLFQAIGANQPLPPLSDRTVSVLFAPGLPKLYRPARSDEEAILEKLSHPMAMREFPPGGQYRHAIQALFSVGAAEIQPSS